MKSYKKVEMVAKNAPSGSYAAGCPQYLVGAGYEINRGYGNPDSSCKFCECSK